jgi:hypothetical protein
MHTKFSLKNLKERLGLRWNNVKMPFKEIWREVGAAVAQSVQRLPTGWTTDVSEFESQKCREFSLLHSIQTGSGVHPTSYPMSTGSSFPGDKAAGA